MFPQTPESFHIMEMIDPKGTAETKREPGIDPALVS